MYLYIPQSPDFLVLDNIHYSVISIILSDAIVFANFLIPNAIILVHPLLMIILI